MSQIVQADCLVFGIYHMTNISHARQPVEPRLTQRCERGFGLKPSATAPISVCIIRKGLSRFQWVYMRSLLVCLPSTGTLLLHKISLARLPARVVSPCWSLGSARPAPRFFAATAAMAGEGESKSSGYSPPGHPASERPNIAQVSTLHNRMLSLALYTGKILLE